MARRTQTLPFQQFVCPDNELRDDAGMNNRLQGIRFERFHVCLSPSSKEPTHSKHGRFRPMRRRVRLGSIAGARLKLRIASCGLPWFCRTITMAASGPGQNTVSPRTFPRQFFRPLDVDVHQLNGRVDVCH